MLAFTFKISTILKIVNQQIPIFLFAEQRQAKAKQLDKEVRDAEQIVSIVQPRLLSQHMFQNEYLASDVFSPPPSSFFILLVATARYGST